MPAGEHAVLDPDQIDQAQLSVIEIAADPLEDFCDHLTFALEQLDELVFDEDEYPGDTDLLVPDGGTCRDIADLLFDREFIRSEAGAAGVQ